MSGQSGIIRLPDERLTVKETVERNFLRFGRNLTVPLMAYTTFLILSAPVSYVNGIIKYGNVVTDFWAFKYTFTHLAQDLYLLALPLAFLLGFYEIFRAVIIGFMQLAQLMRFKLTQSH